MNRVFTIILFFFACKGWGQSVANPVRSLKLYSCETGLIYALTTSEISLKGTWHVPSNSSDTFMKTKLDHGDSIIVMDIFKRLSGKTGNEILLNHCVDDGSNFKIYLYGDTVLKKIFVGNYYDERVNELTLLFDKYIKRYGADLRSYQVGYGSKKTIEEMIKSQQICKPATEDYQLAMLNEWCELKE